MEKKFKSLMDKPIIIAADTQKDWDYILEAKKAFIEKDIPPVPDKRIPIEVIESWQRSKDFHIDWRMKWPPATLSPAETRNLLEENRMLLEAAQPFLEGYNDILEDSEYNMVLYDNKGTILTYSLKRTDENICPGGIRNEKVIGTTAHNLAAFYKRPVQLVGPINYCKALEKNITSSAPILNEYGELLGCIVLYQIQATGSWHLGHNLGWITSTAMAISSQLRLYRRDTRLRVMDETFKTALAHSKDAFISIDPTGYIINFNQEASRLMNVKGEKIKSTFFNMIKDPTAVKKALKTGVPLYNQPMTFLSTGHPLNANIEPFSGEGEPGGAVIKIVHDNTPKHHKITFDHIIHRSPVMTNLIETATLVGRNPVNILLLGESGTGKELFAQAIHNISGSGPFIPINCASIPANLIESELFGYEKGAFTGADKDGRKGKIEYANGGTLFLDEIGDMPLELQPVFLRVLEEKKVVRVGGYKGIDVKFRIIAATNRSLFEEVTHKRFRGDLYFRLSVVNLEIPPLRERENDILLLAEEFIHRICRRFELPRCKLTPESKKVLLNYDWPGNVRQLENAMTYAVSFARNQIITPDNLPREIRIPTPVNVGKLSELKTLEGQLLKNTVEKAGSMEKAARQLGMSRSTLYRKLKEFT